MSKTALLIGATGLVGSRCLVHLTSGRFASAYTRVTCLVRRRGAVALPSDRIEERVVDFGALGDAAVPAVDDVLCATGTTMKTAGSREAFRKIDFDLPYDVAKLAVAKGAKRIALVSSVGADAHASNFYLRTKGELEDALAALPLSALHVFRPSFLVGDRTESRPGEAVALAVSRVAAGLLVGGLRRYRPVDVDLVGCAMVAALQRPDPQPPRKVYEYAEILDLAR